MTNGEKIMTPAHTIITQIQKGTAWSLGLRNFIIADGGSTLQATFGRGNTKQVRITLNANDLYNVKAQKMSLRTFETTKELFFENVGVETLNELLVNIGGNF